MDPTDLSAWLSDACSLRHPDGAAPGESPEFAPASAGPAAIADAQQRHSAELLRASQDAETCARLRADGGAAFESAVELLYGDGETQLGDGDGVVGEGEADCPSPHRHLPRLSVRRRAAAALRNLARASGADPRERRLLRQLDRVRLHCDCARAALCRCGALPRGQPADAATARDRCAEAAAALLQLSYSPAERALLAKLGGVECLADLLLADCCQQSASASHPTPSSRFLRRCAISILTNLTYGDGASKRRLCRRAAALRCLADQLGAPPADPELCRAAAALLRNLSWQAEPSCRRALARLGTAAVLAGAVVRAVAANDEATLRSLLSALWNLTAHSPSDQAAVCDVPDALACLCRCLAGGAALAESAGGVLRNLGPSVAASERLRSAVRPALPLLLGHLREPAPTIVANACGILRCLSSGHPGDARLLSRLGAEPLLRRLLRSRHRVIADACAGALANLAPASAAAAADSSDRQFGTLPRLRRPSREPARLLPGREEGGANGPGRYQREPLWTTTSFPMPVVSGAATSCGGGGFGPMAMSGLWEQRGRAERDLYPLLEETLPLPPCALPQPPSHPPLPPPPPPPSQLQPAPPPPQKPSAPADPNSNSKPTAAAGSCEEVELSDISSASLSSVLEIDASGMLRDGCPVDDDADSDTDSDIDVDNCQVEPHCASAASALSAVSAAKPTPPAAARQLSSSAIPVPGSAPVSQLPRLVRAVSSASGSVSDRAAAISCGFSTLQPRRRGHQSDRRDAIFEAGSLPRPQRSRPDDERRRASTVAAAPPTTRLPVPWSAPPRSAASKAKPLGVVAPTIVRPPKQQQQQQQQQQPPPPPLNSQTLPHCRLSSLSKDSGYADSMLSSSTSQTPVGGGDEKLAALMELAKPGHPPTELPAAPASSRGAALTRRSSSGIPVASHRSADLEPISATPNQNADNEMRPGQGRCSDTH